MRDIMPRTAEERQAIAFMVIALGLNAVFYTVLYIFAKGWVLTVLVCHTLIGCLYLANLMRKSN